MHTSVPEHITAMYDPCALERNKSFWPSVAARQEAEDPRHRNMQHAQNYKRTGEQQRIQDTVSQKSRGDLQRMPQHDQRYHMLTCQQHISEREPRHCVHTGQRHASLIVEQAREERKRQRRHDERWLREEIETLEIDDDHRQPEKKGTRPTFTRMQTLWLWNHEILWRWHRRRWLRGQNFGEWWLGENMELDSESGGHIWAA